jgi:hypothetical protein
VASSSEVNLSYLLPGRSEAVAMSCVKLGCIRSKFSSTRDIVPRPFSICSKFPAKLYLRSSKDLTGICLVVVHDAARNRNLHPDEPAAVCAQA